MPFTSRRADDADVIRARLRALLAEGAARPGWLPDDGPVPPGGQPARGRPQPWDDDEDEDSWTLAVEDDEQDMPRGRQLTAEHPAQSEPHVPPEPSEPTGSAEPSVPSGGRSGRHRASGASTRVDPGPHGAGTLWAVALVAALAVAGWSWLSRPEVSPVGPAAAAPAASTGSPTGGVGEAGTSAAAGAGVGTAAGTGSPGLAQIVVAVVGLVADPGVVTLPAGARVADALAAAGGLLPEADPSSINAAALLTDGQQVAVGVPGAGGGAGADAGAGATGGADGALVDLNTAGVADLDALPGIGPVLAQRIVDHRTEHGPFSSVEQLDDVSGIGPSLYAELAPLVTV